MSFTTPQWQSPAILYTTIVTRFVSLAMIFVCIWTRSICVNLSTIIYIPVFIVIAFVFSTVIYLSSSTFSIAIFYTIVVTPSFDQLNYNVSCYCY